MAVNRDLWRPQWAEDDIPSLPCPNCGAPLNADYASMIVKTSDHNQKLVDLTGIDDAESRFSLWMSCGHAKCVEPVAAIGSCEYEHAYDQAGQTITERILFPCALYPAPPIIAVADEVPEQIEQALARSFAVFWTSYNACAGRLRVALELILQSWGFPAYVDGKFVSLHRRIERWRDMYCAEQIAQSLMAIKWLGNIGSHAEEIDLDRLLDAYDIIERLLRQLFPPDERPLDELANEIVSSKGHTGTQR